MGTNAVQRGPTAETVSANVKRLRTEQNLGLRGLATKLAEVGRPLTHSAVDQIEKGNRRVDVDDLLALAAALDVTVAALLMPEPTEEEWDTFTNEVKMADSWVAKATGHPEGVPAKILWKWLTAAGPPRAVEDERDRFAWLARAVPRRFLPFGKTVTRKEGADLGDD